MDISHAPQSGVRQRFFAPGAKTHVMSPSPSLTGINVQVARKRCCDEEPTPQSRPPR